MWLSCSGAVDRDGAWRGADAEGLVGRVVQGGDDVGEERIVKNGAGEGRRGEVLNSEGGAFEIVRRQRRFLQGGGAGIEAEEREGPVAETRGGPTSGTTALAAPKVGADKNWVIVTGESCNLRSTQASSSKILEELGKYSPVKRLGEKSGDYEKVEAMSKKTGWVRSSLLGKTAYVSVSEGQTNLRKDPGKDQEILWVLARDYPLRALDRKDDYVQVEDWEGTKGWVHESRLSTKHTAIVKGTTADLRGGPGKEYEILAHAEQKVMFEIVQQQGDWVEVRHENGNRGWIWTGLLWGAD
ncbi:MAG: SH3 domain-containing protein [Candidatus Sumerlaeota bacterium]|nr:SH3 domain-containing protein [Candidatus Sumerlaeota bacterium]